MDFRYLVETKNEFNNFLCSLLIPHIFHGIKGMFKYSENVYDQIEQKNKKGYKINNPGIIHIFKKTLEGISSLNNHEIEEEYQRIKNTSGYADWFDNLVKASFKSYVLYLTWDPKSSISKYSDNSIYDNISIKDFIHKCYITSCDYFKENPELFINNKANKKDILDIIKTCIELAIKKTIPYNQMIQEYLQIEFNIKNNVNTLEIANIKNMVNNIINNQKYGIKPPIKNIIKETDEEYINIEDLNTKKNQLENFIKNETLYDDIHSVKSNKSQYKKSLILSNEQISDTSNTNLINELTSDSINNNLHFGGYNQTSTKETSALITRSKIKSKELSDLMDNQIMNNSLSETSNNSKLQKSFNSKEPNILTSPLIIKKKPNDRLHDDFLIDDKKKNIKVIINKKNEMSDKFDALESFYDSMIK